MIEYICPYKRSRTKTKPTLKAQRLTDRPHTTFETFRQAISYNGLALASRKIKIIIVQLNAISYARNSTDFLNFKSSADQIELEIKYIGILISSKEFLTVTYPYKTYSALIFFF